MKYYVSDNTFRLVMMALGEEFVAIFWFALTTQLTSGGLQKWAAFLLGCVALVSMFSYSWRAAGSILHDKKNGDAK